MIQPTIRDYFIGQALAGLLAQPRQPIESGILSESEEMEAHYGEQVEIAFEIADAVMQIRKLRAEEN